MSAGLSPDCAAYPQLKLKARLLTAHHAARTVSASSGPHISLFCLELSLLHHNQRRTCHEKNFSAQQPEAQTHPWVSCAHGNEGWPAGAEASASEGPGTIVPLRARDPSAILVRSPAGFARPRRLTTSSEFGSVFAQPVRSSDRYFTVLARPGNCDNARLGLAISKRVDKRASVRNRLKRLSREVFRANELPALDFVVMARPDAPAAENEVLIESLQRHFSRITRRTETGGDG